MFTLGTAFGELEWDPDYMEFLMYQKESGAKTGYEHWQGFFKLKKKQLALKVKEHLGFNELYIKVMKGTFKHCEVYCSKSETQIEEPKRFGVEPEGGQGNRSDIHAVAEAIKSGKRKREIVEEFTTSYIKYHAGIEKTINELRPERTEPLIVYCLYGDSHTGKSWFAKTHLVDGDDNVYEMPLDAQKPWFDGYHGQEAILLDEFNGQWKIEWLKHFLSSRKCPLPYKGGYVRNDSKYIVITSNSDPRVWYDCLSPINWTALSRRFTFCYIVRGSSHENCTYQVDKKEARLPLNF